MGKNSKMSRMRTAALGEDLSDAKSSLVNELRRKCVGRDLKMAIAGNVLDSFAFDDSDFKRFIFKVSEDSRGAQSG